MIHFYNFSTNTIRATIAVIGMVFLLPSVSSAFFCNQPKVTVQWAKNSMFKIDGDGFTRGNFTVIDAGDPSLIQFDKMEIIDGLEAEFEITGLKPGQTEIAVRWIFADKSDSGICDAMVEVTDLPYPSMSARADVMQYINGLGLDAGASWAFMYPDPVCAGSQVQSADQEDVNLTLDSDKWFAYIDFSKDLRYSHYGRYVFIDAETGDMTTEDVEWYPLIDGVPYMSDVMTKSTTEDRIFGTVPMPVSEPNSAVNDPVSNTTPKTEVCAVLVSGTADNPRQIESFEQDVDFVKKNLMGERLGPQLAESDVAVLNNASFQEIREKLESFEGKYSKVYFYYSGHGAENYMVTNDTVGNRMWYVDLANALEATGADDICVIIDACHSGGAIDVFQRDEGLQSSNVTLLTSCRKDTTSWTRYIITGGGDTVRTGEYTWAFVRCFGDPNADEDGDNEISLKEAHRWALMQNPTLDVGGTLRGRMDPQCWVHRAPETTEQVIRPADTRMTIDQGTENRIPETSELRIDMRYETGDTTTSDPNVFHISPEIQWDMRLVPDVGGYKIGLKFDYSFAESQFTGLGEPGIVWKEDDENEWTQYVPTIVDKDGKTVTALDLEKLGLFAVAEVRSEPSTGVPSGTEKDGFALEPNTPNPFTGSTRIFYTLPEAAQVTLSIVDKSGRTVATMRSGRQEAGSHAAIWDGRDASGSLSSSGTYHITLHAVASGGANLRLTRQVMLVR